MALQAALDAAEHKMEEALAKLEGMAGYTNVNHHCDTVLTHQRIPPLRCERDAAWHAAHSPYEPSAEP